MEFADAIQDETIETPPASQTVPRETFMHMMEDSLSDEETLAKKDRLVDVDRKILEVEAEKAAAVSEFNKELKELRKERVTLLDVIGTGKVKREVECYEDRDDRRGHMLVRRLDTDEVVDERPLSASERDGDAPADERQGDLFANGSAEAVDERTPEQIAADAEESGRLVRTTSAEARQRRAERQELPEDTELGDDDEDAPDSEDADDQEGDDVA